MVCRETWSLSANTTMHGEQSITDSFSLKRRKPIPSLTGGQHSKIVSDGMLRKHILLQHVNVSEERKDVKLRMTAIGRTYAYSFILI